MENVQHLIIPDYVNQTGKATNIKLSYQIFGKALFSAPIVLVNHALTGNSNVCGSSGWWSDLIGDNKCIDTLNYTILAFNIPGNGFDDNPDYLIDNYKNFVARDIAKLFVLGLEQLKINKLFAIIGGSVGGGIAWEMALLKPNLAAHVIPVATDWKATDWLIANCYIQEVILNNSNQPLVDARMHAMTLYRTPESLAHKFKRTKKTTHQFNVESWLSYHGKSLSDRFQLQAYKMMNHVLKTIDITHNRGNFLDIAKQIQSNIHIITINSDLFFKAEENWDTYIKLKAVKENVSIGEIKSIHGHDAFLIEFDQLSKLLNPIFSNQEYNSTLLKSAI